MCGKIVVSTVLVGLFLFPFLCAGLTHLSVSQQMAETGTTTTDVVEIVEAVVRIEIEYHRGFLTSGRMTSNFKKPVDVDAEMRAMSLELVRSGAGIDPPFETAPNPSVKYLISWRWAGSRSNATTAHIEKPDWQKFEAGQRWEVDQSGRFIRLLPSGD